MCGPSWPDVMTDWPVSGARRFRSTVPYYLKGRPVYPARLIRRVVLLCGLTATQRVMDLGCGPGQLAVAFAPFAAEVVAIDPEPAMLDAAADHAAQAGVEVRFIEASSDDLDSALGLFRLVTIGRAFHWMNRTRTLGRLDQLIDTSGAVVLFRDRHPDLPDNAWRVPYRALTERFAVQDDARNRRTSAGWQPHEAVLLESPFCCLERITVIERLRTPVETFVDRALSMSSMAPARIGARSEDLACEMRALMAGFATNGHVTEIVESDALIARRPA
jgi:SAM-dependent methyltransferase